MCSHVLGLELATHEWGQGDADVDQRWAVDTPTPAQNISRLKVRI